MIDWEKRLYETAKELLPSMVHAHCGNHKNAAQDAVKAAEELINQLKTYNRNEEDNI